MGTKEYYEIKVTTLANGSQLSLPVHRIVGDKPGRCLGMTALLHGDETLPNSIFRRVVAELNPAEMSGSLLLIPVMNPLAYEALTRHTPLDMMNMNRVFPGNPNGWLTEQTARKVVDEFIPKIDCLLDWHSGSSGTFPTVDYVIQSTLDPKLGPAFGMKVVADGGIPGSLATYAESMGIPTIYLEIGGGAIHEQKYIDIGVKGTYNVLKYLGILDGKSELPQQQIYLKDRMTIRTHSGGTIYPEVGLEKITEVVPGGTVLGKVVSPFTFEELEVIKAPYEQTLVFLLWGAISRINPGETAYMVGDASTAEIINNAQ